MIKAKASRKVPELPDRLDSHWQNFENVMVWLLFPMMERVTTSTR
jgi:hypothetical protein